MGEAARTARRLRGFDRVAKRLARSLTRHHGTAFAEAVLADARREYERLIPQLPDIGGWRASSCTLTASICMIDKTVFWIACSGT